MPLLCNNWILVITTFQLYVMFVKMQPGWVFPLVTALVPNKTQAPYKFFRSIAEPYAYIQRKLYHITAACCLNVILTIC